MNKNISRLIKLSFLIIIFLIYLYSKDKILPFFFPKKIIQPFKNLTVDNVDQLSITFENKTLDIIKKDKQWTTNGFKADKERINQIIQKASEIIQDDIVSTNVKKHAELGIVENKIVFQTKNIKHILYIGNNSTIDKNYVRVNDNNEVFAISGFANVFSPFDYRDLQVNFINDENKITSITINDLNLEKKKDKWFINDKEAKKDQVDFFLNDLKTLKATDILSKEIPLLYPELVIKTQTNEANFYPINSDPENFYLKISNSPFIFQIPAVSVNSLKKVEKDFIE